MTTLGEWKPKKTIGVTSVNTTTSTRFGVRLEDYTTEPMQYAIMNTENGGNPSSPPNTGLRYSQENGSEFKHVSPYGTALTGSSLKPATRTLDGGAGRINVESSTSVQEMTTSVSHLIYADVMNQNHDDISIDESILRYLMSSAPNGPRTTVVNSVSQRKISIEINALNFTAIPMMTIESNDSFATEATTEVLSSVSITENAITSLQEAVVASSDEMKHKEWVTLEVMMMNSTTAMYSSEIMKELVAIVSNIDNSSSLGNTSGNSTGDSTDQEWFLNAVGLIRWFYLPIIIIGTITNVTNLVVFSRPYMRKLSTIVYLSALAAGDIINLYFELFRYWLEWMDWLVPPEQYFSDAYCKSVNYLGYASRDLTNWLVAFVTIERIIVLAVPFKAKTFCTPRKARILVCVLTLTVLIAHIPSLIITKAIKNVTWVCWAKTDSEAIDVLTKIVFYFFGNTVIALVFVLNVTLIFLLYRARKLQPRGSASSNVNRRKAHGKRLTGMLLSVGIMFIVCELPRLVVLSLYGAYGGTPFLRIAMSLAFLLSGINHTSNFFIYVLSGKRFRRVFLNTVRCLSSSEDGNSRAGSLTKLKTYKCQSRSVNISNSVCTADSEVSRQIPTMSSQLSVDSQRGGSNYLCPPSPCLGTRM